MNMLKIFITLMIILFSQYIWAQLLMIAQKPAGEVVIPGYTPPAESVPPGGAPSPANQPPPNFPPGPLPGSQYNGGTSSTGIAPMGTTMTPGGPMMTPPEPGTQTNLVVTPTEREIKAATSAHPVPASTAVRDEWKKFFSNLNDCTAGVYNLQDPENPDKNLPFKITGWSSDDPDTQKCNLKMDKLECHMSKNTIKALVDRYSAMVGGREPSKTTNDTYNRLTGEECIPGSM